ncbi:hypothetical protein C8N47_102255 [Mangrovibacterium marinum]|uniref:Sensor of ECF-type sigma factor n=2 Tax=Mangrovibacterium marinum TaxID=1639118 RepID=A0A2T5C5S3_9BACT|nr:hypothetical protein C8N47_102255 [Mangrovibacterium marinum]
MKFLQNSTINKMMRKTFIFLVLSIFTASVFGQPPQNDKHEDFEIYKAKRVSYMTEKLQLTPDEAQKFWPLYNEFDKKRADCHWTRKRMEDEIRQQYDQLTEKDFKKMNSEIVQLYIQEANLLKEYNDKFLTVLPARKVILVGPTENEFRFQMIREYRQKRRDENKQ